MLTLSCLRGATFFAAKESGKRNHQRKPIPRRFPLESFPDGQGRNRAAFSPIGSSFRGTGTGVLHRTTVPGNIRGGIQWGAIGPLWPGGGVQGNLSEGSPGAPLVTFPASGKSRPRKGPQPCFSASRGSQSAAAGERPQALFILPPRQEAGNEPVRRKTAQPCGLRLLTHLGQ